MDQLSAVNLARQAIERLLGTRPLSVHKLTATVFDATLTDGTQVVAKRGQGPGAVRVEVAGLHWLAEPGAVRIPEVLGADEDWLVLPRIEAGAPGDAAEFGAQLANLHAAGARSFGAPPPGVYPSAWIGNAPMPVAEGDAWPHWYVQHRVLNYLRTAVDAGLMGTSGVRAIELACAWIDDLAGPAQRPARLHGDLWSGNVLWSADGGAWLIDPAAHGGHRETDIAMLHLFRYPKLQSVLAGYQEVWPLPDGWEQRIPLHQLFPLLVHTVLFGGDYADRAEAAALAAMRAR